MVFASYTYFAEHMTVQSTSSTISCDDCFYFNTRIRAFVNFLASSLAVPLVFLTTQNAKRITWTQEKKRKVGVAGEWRCQWSSELQGKAAPCPTNYYRSPRKRVTASAGSDPRLIQRPMIIGFVAKEEKTTMPGRLKLPSDFSRSQERR